MKVHVAFTLLVFAYLAIFRWHDLLTTRLGNMLAIAISIYWYLRAANQLLFYGNTAADLPMFGLGVIFGLRTSFLSSASGGRPRRKVKLGQRELSAR